MSEPKVIWSGTYAGIDADVRVVNGKPVPFLAGRAVVFGNDVDGVFGAAVMGLAVELGYHLQSIQWLQAEVAAHKKVSEISARTSNETYQDELRLRELIQQENAALRERLNRIEEPAKRLVDIDNDLAEGRDVTAKASFHDAVMRPIEELRGYFGNVARAEKREQTIFDVEADRRKRAERERDELRERLVKLEAGLATACNEWEYASQYKGEFLAEKHGDAEDIAELRELLKGAGDVKA